MIAHYFGDATLHGNMMLEEVLATMDTGTLTVTPAMLESLCARSETVSDLVGLLQKDFCARVNAEKCDQAAPSLQPVSLQRVASREQGAG